MELGRKKHRKTDPMPCAAVVVAAGSASRMQGIDKALADLNGKPVLLHTLEAFEMCERVDTVVVVTREDLITPVEQLCRDHQITKVQQVLSGGSDRTRSVLRGLDALAQREGLAAIHDGARPLVTQEILLETIAKAERTGAAAPAVPVKDTIKVTGDGVIAATPDRSRLVAIQTPQIFDLDFIRGALYKALEDDAPLTDDCSAAERLGMQVHLTEGSEENLKITTPMDLVVAQAVLKRREQP